MTTRPRKQLLFNWTGWAPKGVERHAHRSAQVPCAIVLATKAEFMRLTGYNAGYVRDYVNVEPVSGDHAYNPVHAAAVAKPGTLFWQDDVRHTPGERVVCEYDGDYTLV